MALTHGNEGTIAITGTDPVEANCIGWTVEASAQDHDVTTFDTTQGFTDCINGNITVTGTFTTYLVSGTVSSASGFPALMGKSSTVALTLTTSASGDVWTITAQIKSVANAQDPNGVPTNVYSFKGTGSFTAT